MKIGNSSNAQRAASKRTKWQYICQVFGNGPRARLTRLAASLDRAIVFGFDRAAARRHLRSFALCCASEPRRYIVTPKTGVFRTGTPEEKSNDRDWISAAGKRSRPDEQSPSEHFRLRLRGRERP